MKGFLKNHKYFVIILVIVLLFSVYYVVALRMAVGHYVGQFEQKYASSENLLKDTVSLYRVPGYHELLKQQGALSSLVQLAQSDSVGLLLNLSDSTVRLLIKGLAVRVIPIRELQMSALFRRAKEDVLYQWLSAPFKITTRLSSIEREPLNSVIAPKDTSDEREEVVPDTLHKKSVFWIWDTDRELELYFYQSDGEDQERAVQKFHLKEKWADICRNLKAVFTFSVPEYKPVLEIGLTQEDAEVVYRALPQKGQVIITF